MTSFSRIARRFFAVVLVLTAAPALMAGEKRYVDPKSADPKSPFATPGTAARDLHAALEVAESDDVVVVAPGRYAVDKPVVVKKGVKLQGAGADKTIFDAQDKCRCVTLSPNSELWGVTVTGGNAKHGGGIHCGPGTTIADCIVTKNSAQNLGGGIYAQNGNPKQPACEIRDCKITENRVVGFLHTDTPLGGGGIYAQAVTTISNCLIEGNEAAQRAGGIWCHGAGVVADGCVIAGNRAKGRRAGNPNGTGSMEEGGGGAYCDFGGQLRSCLVRDNRADKVGGGAILSTGGNARNCTFVANDAGVSGGGVETLGVAGLVNSIVWNNTRGKGAADDLYVSHYYHVDIHQLTLGKLNLKHCCIGKSDLHATKQSFYLGRTAKYDPKTYKNTLNQTECLEKDPQFVDLGKGDYRLKAGSPCIDAANVESWMEKARDLNRRPRVQGAKVDLGAYEAGE